MRRWTLGLWGVALLVAGCANESSPSQQPTSDPLATTPANIVTIVCDRNVSRVSDPVVRAFPEGVRVLFENPGGAWGFEFHPHSFEHGSGSGGRLGSGSDRFDWTLPPGDVTVACLPDARSSYWDTDANPASFTVVDPDGLYIAWELACASPERSRVEVAAHRDEDPEQVFRRVSGIELSDDLLHPGYPETLLKMPTSIVFRDGAALARVMGSTTGTDGVAELLVDSCPGSGIGS